MRVAVIGAGVVGASVAFRLQQHAGIEVTLVDRGEPGSGTTGASFAWANANRKLPRSYFDLNHAGLTEHRTLAEQTPGAPWLHQTGNLMWTTEETEIIELRERVERLRGWDYAAEWLDTGRERRELEPEVSFPAEETPVAYFPHEAWVDAPSLASRLVELAVRGGARLRLGEALEGIQVANRTVRGILLGGERLDVDAVVNACGPQAGEVASMAGLGLPISAKSGLLAKVAAEPSPLSRLMHTDRVNLRPGAGGGIILHHDSVDRMFWKRPDAAGKLSELLLRRAREVIPALGGSEITEIAVGVRPVPEDGLPCVGPVPELAGYYEAVTHSGVTLGPLIGRLLADEVSSGQVHPLLAPFRASRFSRYCG